jgi:hypothetical protein
MSLKGFVQGGFEVTDAKILVIVKSISTRKRGQCVIQCRACAALTDNSHEKRWNHSGTRKGRRDGRYERSNTIVMGRHFNKPYGLAAIPNRTANHKSQPECLASDLVSIDVKHLHRCGPQYSGGRKTSSIRRTDDQKTAHQSSLSRRR